MPRAVTDCTILMVDDEEANLDLLEAFLSQDGYRSLVRTTDAREAVDRFADCAPDLVLLDLHMPFRDGFQVLADIRSRTPPDEYLPVLVLTADITADARERALSSGARDFITKPFDAVEVLLRVRNLLEARMMHCEQREARVRAEAAERARDRMLSVVAHDLRNPLALVAMNAEMLLELLDPESDPYQHEMLETMARASARMQRLVEDLLDVSRLEMGGFSLEIAEHAPDALVHEAIGMMRPAARTAAVSLHIEAGDELPSVRVDGARVVQVLSNLIGNAVKFTPAGGCITVSVGVAGEELQIRVTDTGAGIPADKLPHVFRAFWQVDETDRRGAGLGLWIARTLVEAHGGRISVESREGEGSMFAFTIPLLDSPVGAGLHVTHRSADPCRVDGLSAPSELRADRLGPP
jgi:signal transduction histidine kinase